MYGAILLPISTSDGASAGLLNPDRPTGGMGAFARGVPPVPDFNSKVSSSGRSAPTIGAVAFECLE